MLNWFRSAIDLGMRIPSVRPLGQIQSDVADLLLLSWVRSPCVRFKSFPLARGPALIFHFLISTFCASPVSNSLFEMGRFTL